MMPFNISTNVTYDGVEKMYLKYKITQDDVDRGTAKGTTGTGIVNTTATDTSVSPNRTFNLVRNCQLYSSSRFCNWN